MVPVVPSFLPCAREHKNMVDLWDVTASSAKLHDHSEVLTAWKTDSISLPSVREMYFFDHSTWLLEFFANIFFFHYVICAFVCYKSLYCTKIKLYEKNTLIGPFRYPFEANLLTKTRWNSPFLQFYKPLPLFFDFDTLALKSSHAKPRRRWQVPVHSLSK